MVVLSLSSPPQQSSRPRTCTNCGAALRLGKVRCRNCGQEVDRATDRVEAASDSLRPVVADFSQTRHSIEQIAHNGGGSTGKPSVEQSQPSQSTQRAKCACGKRLRAKKDFSGKKLRCPRCGRGVLIPPVTRQVTAAAALGTLQASEAVDGLLERLTDSAPEVVRTAVVALGKIPDARSTQALLQLGSDQPKLRFVVSEAITHIGRIAVGELVRAVNQGSPENAVQAVTILGRIQDKQAVKPLISLLENDQANLRARAAEALGRIKDRRALPPLINLLRDDDANVRVNAAQALAAMPDIDCLEPLIGALKDSDPDVQLQAICALGNIADKRASQAVAAMLQASQPRLRAGAAEALGKIGDKNSLAALLQSAQDSAESVRLQAATALARIPDSSSVQTLQELLRDSNRVIRQRAVEGLGTIGSSTAVQSLSDILREDRSVDVRAAAAEALGEIGDPAGVSALQDALDDEFAVRSKAVIALGTIGDHSTFTVLLGMLQDQTPEIRYLAATALGAMDHPHSAGVLFRLRNDESLVVRQGAARALEKLEDPRATSLSRDGSFQNLKRGTVRIAKLVIPSGPLARSKTQCATWATSIALLIILGLSWTFWKSTGAAANPASFHGKIASLSFHPDGRQLYLGWTNDLVEVWDPFTGQLDRTFSAGGGHVRGLGFAADDKTIILAVNRAVYFQQDENVLGKYEEHKRPIQKLIMTPDRRTADTMSADGDVIIWDVQSRIPQSRVTIPNSRAAAVALSPDGNLLAVSVGDGTISVWNPETKEEIVEYQTTPGKFVSSLAFSPDGRRLAAATIQGGVIVWDNESKKELARTSTHKSINAIVFHPDSRRLAVVRGNRLQLWDVHSNQTQEFPKVDSAGLDFVTFDPHGKLAAAAGQEDRQVWIFELESREVLQTLGE